MLAILFVLGCVHDASACDAVLGPGRQGDDGSWQFDVEASAVALGAVGVVVRENGEDVSVDLGSGGVRFRTDIPPTRFAIERVFVPFWGRATATVRVRAIEDATTHEPSIEAVCLDAWQRDFAPALAWSAATDGAYVAARETDDARRERSYAAAVSLAERWSGPADDEWPAAAAMLRGYLAEQTGRYVDAASAFEQAETAWRGDRRTLVQALAARFYRAKAQFAAGRTDTAVVLLDELTSDRTLQRFPAIGGWARNDRCLALRPQNRMAEAADCLAALAPQLRAVGERREAANVLCNLGSVQGTLGRWMQATATLERCRAEREALGTPDGLAHASLLLGWAQLEAGDVDSATEAFERSLEQARRTGDRAPIWKAQRWLAQAWIEGDDLDRAADTLSRIEPDAQQDAPRHAEWTAALGAVALLRNATDDARRLLHAGAAEFDTLGDRSGAERARCRLALLDAEVGVTETCDAMVAAEVALRRGHRDVAVQALAAPQPSPEHELLRAALLALYGGGNVAERVRSPLSRALSLSGASGRVAGIRERLLSRLGFELARASAASGGDHALSSLALTALLHAGDRSNAIGLPLAALSDVRMTSASTATLPPLPALAQGELLLASTRWLDEHYLVVAGDDGRVATIAVDADAVERAVAALNEAVAKDSAIADAARAVSAALKLDVWLPPQTGRLRLIVQGRLMTLPWAALAIPGEPVARLGYRPLVDRVVVSHVVVGLAPTTAHAAMPHRLAFFGDAEAARDSLPGVAQEALALAGAARDAGWKVDRVAVGGAWRGGPIGVLHIGGHARADPMRGALYVATADGWQRAVTPDDAVREASLVVLAGCETAAGMPSRWSGNRSWGVRMLERGAGESLAHLWPVADTAAARLHVAFYEELFGGVDPDVALAKAQRTRLAHRIDATPLRWASGVIFTRWPR